ncbi:MAG: aminotransferase class V-fold PLP-dependent enzyme [Rhodothermales bacterium]
MSHVDWQAIRALFPAVERYTYLNTASGGVLSAYAADAAKRYYDEAHTQADVLWDEWLDRAEHVRAQTARFLNADPDEIAFLPNSSLGLNLAAHLFDGEGDVLTTEDEFPSGTLPWLQRGHAVRFLPTDDEGGVSTEAIAEAVETQTRRLVTSSVQYQTGFRHDLAALGCLCRARDLTFIVDATQGVGAFPLDVRRQQIDVLVFSGYKWATAGYGIAVLYIRKDLLASRALPMVGWRSARTPYALVNDRLDLAAHTTTLELGHPLFPGIFALGGALRLFEEIGSDQITARVHALTAYLHRRLAEHHLTILSTQDPAHRSGITMLGVEDPQQVVDELKAQNIFVAARGRGIRVSLHFYNNHDDVDCFVNALTRVSILDLGF